MTDAMFCIGSSNHWSGRSKKASAMFKDGRQGRNLAEDLARLTLPIQVVWGAKDAIIPAAHAKALPNARVEVIDAAGHMAQMEAAGRVNDLIKAQVAR